MSCCHCLRRHECLPAMLWPPLMIAQELVTVDQGLPMPLQYLPASGHSSYLLKKPARRNAMAKRSEVQAQSRSIEQRIRCCARLFAVAVDLKECMEQRELECS